MHPLATSARASVCVKRGAARLVLKGYLEERWVFFWGEGNFVDRRKDMRCSLSLLYEAFDFWRSRRRLRPHKRDVIFPPVHDAEELTYEGGVVNEFESL